MNDTDVLRRFKSLKKALSTIIGVHSYTLDLGFALGLLKQCGSDKVVFHVDGAGYRPAKLSSDEWREITDSHRFYLVPHLKNKGVFHSKAWIFKIGLLLGSCNLSFREAKENLNFWCWMPDWKWNTHRNLFDKDDSITICWELNGKKPEVKKTPLEAVKQTLKGIQLDTMVIVTPQPPATKLLTELEHHLSNDGGNCFFFLAAENHGLKTLPKQKRWNVTNYIPKDASNGLHGKAFYGEWGKKNKQGAVLYVGSANFTKAAWTGDNIETGVLVKAEGGRQVSVLQKALTSLLGKTGTGSIDEKAWATERFNGQWIKVPAPDNNNRYTINRFSKDDIALGRFIDELKANNHCLRFPACYGSRDAEIKKAELFLEDCPSRLWKKPKRRQFAGIVWSPEAKLKLTIKGGRTRVVYLPPLEGLMGGAEENSKLLALLMNPPKKATEDNVTSKNNNDWSNELSIYSAYSRVLFPWQAFAKKGLHRLLQDKRELKETLRILRERLKEPVGKDERLTYRKLKNISFCIESLLEGNN